MTKFQTGFGIGSCPHFQSGKRSANVPASTTYDMKNHEMKNNGSWLAALAMVAAMPVAADDWTAMRLVDRMTDEEKVLGVYALTSPEEPRPSVYADIHGSLMIECRDRYALFQLIDTEGFVVDLLPPGMDHEIRARFDNETVQELAAYTFGERSLLVFNPDPDMLSLAEGRRRVLIEVPSVKGHYLYFDFSLTGLREAHRETCG